MVTKCKIQSKHENNFSHKPNEIRKIKEKKKEKREKRKETMVEPSETSHKPNNFSLKHL